MIKYNLECKCGKKFESWFSSSAEYDDLRKKKLINCIYCNSISVKKSVMAPNLASKTNKIIERTKTEKKIKKQLLEFRRFVEKNYKNVGTDFAKEARAIHYDKKTSKGIYGSVSPDETESLLEEGIDIATIPWVKPEN